MDIKDPRTRAYIYGVVLAVIPLLQFFRLIPGDAVPLVVNIVTAVLGTGAAALALPNTPTKPVAGDITVRGPVALSGDPVTGPLTIRGDGSITVTNSGKHVA